MLPACVFFFVGGSAMYISFPIACCVSCRIMSFAVQAKDTGVLKVLVCTSELKTICGVLFPHNLPERVQCRYLLKPENNVEILFNPMISHKHEGRCLFVCLFEVSHASSSNSKTKMSTEHWRNLTDRGNRSTGRKTCPSAILSTTNITWTDMGSNTGPCCDRPRANRRSHGTASWIIRIIYVNAAAVLQRTQRVCIAGIKRWTSYCRWSAGYSYRIYRLFVSCSSWYVYLPLYFKVLHISAQEFWQVVHC